MRSTLTLLAVSTSIALALSACTVTTDSVDTDAGATDASAADGSASRDAAPADGGADGAACTLEITTQQGPSCDQCLQTSCCAEVNTCLTNADCVALIACVAGCDAKDAADPSDAGSEQSACLKDCSTAHSASVNAFVDYSVCVVPACQTGAEAPCQ